MGDYKLIEWFETGRLELYDLSQDIGETNDLSESHPQVLAQLHQRMKAWRAEVGAPVPQTPNPGYDPAASPSKGSKRNKK